MNPTIAHFDQAYEPRHPMRDESPSLLDTIVARLKSMLEIHARQPATHFRAQTFIEENLLDPRMGPEISRCLHR